MLSSEGNTRTVLGSAIINRRQVEKEDAMNTGDNGQRRTFVLVHGAWGGGWAWAAVARLLRDSGHDVYTPTLTGLGERVHLRNPEIALDTHVQDVVNVLEYERLSKVVLVGWSYGGMVVTPVAERVPERLARLVYLDAFVPEDGESLIDLMGPEVTAQMVQAAQAMGDGWRIPFGGPVEDGRPNTDMLLRPGEQPVTVRNPLARVLPHAYICCTERENAPVLLGVARSAARVRQDPAWAYRELPTGHDAVWTMPGAVAGLLVELASLEKALDPAVVL